MGDLATLLTAIGTLVSAGVSTAGLGIAWLRSSKRERKDAAEIAAERTEQVAEVRAIDELLDALAGDGQISDVEVKRIRDHLHPKEGNDE